MDFAIPTLLSNSDKKRSNDLEALVVQIANHCLSNNLSGNQITNLVKNVFDSNPNLNQFVLDRVNGKKLQPEDLVEKVNDHLKPSPNTKTQTAKNITAQSHLSI